MLSITPEEARRIEALNAGGIGVDRAASIICDLAGQIADMTYEYAVQVRIQENGHWHRVTEWNPDPNPYKPGNAPRNNERIVRRLVSQPEEVKP